MYAASGNPCLWQSPVVSVSGATYQAQLLANTFQCKDYALASPLYELQYVYTASGQAPCVFGADYEPQLPFLCCKTLFPIGNPGAFAQCGSGCTYPSPVQNPPFVVPVDPCTSGYPPCASYVPRVLHATFTQCSCAALNGVTVPLIWPAEQGFPLPEWQGFTCRTNEQIVFAPYNGVDWEISPAPNTGFLSGPGNWSCSPFSVLFKNVVIPPSQFEGFPYYPGCDASQPITCNIEVTL
jgi:hypothetical protein